MSKVALVGLAGTNGSGKDTMGQILAEHFGFLFISVTDILRAEAKKREQPPDRAVLRQISQEWREKYGLGVLVERAWQNYLQNTNKYSGLVVASIRNPGEVDTVHDLGGVVVWIDADSTTRYQRIQANRSSRNRASEDDISYEQFLEHEAAEMTPKDKNNQAALNMVVVKDKADEFILNNDSDLNNFKSEIKNKLNL